MEEARVEDQAGNLCTALKMKTKKTGSENWEEKMAQGPVMWLYFDVSGAEHAANAVTWLVAEREPNATASVVA